TDGGLPVSKEVVGESEPRTEVTQGVVLDDGTKSHRVGVLVDYPGFLVLQLARRVHEFIAEAQVYRHPRGGPPVVLAIEAIGVVDEKAVFIGKGGRKLYLGWYALQEIR